jgi:hypothetical protein
VRTSKTITLLKWASAPGKKAMAQLEKTLSVVIFHLVIFIKIGEVGGGSGGLLQSVHEALLITKETISEEDLSDLK